MLFRFLFTLAFIFIQSLENLGYAETAPARTTKKVAGRTFVSSDINRELGVRTSVILPANIPQYTVPCRIYGAMRGIQVLVEIEGSKIESIPSQSRQREDDFKYYAPYFGAASRWVNSVCPRVVFCRNVFSFDSPNGNKEVCDQDNGFHISVTGTFMDAAMVEDGRGYGPTPKSNSWVFIGTLKKNQSGAWEVSSWDNYGLISNRENTRRTIETNQKIQAEAHAKEAAASRRFSLRADFLNKFNAVGYMQQQTLAVNVFPYKHKVVGIPTLFVQMIAENVAIFGNGMQIKNVPSDVFRQSGTPLVLAMKVIGISDSTRQPIGEYVGDYRCWNQACTDFFDQFPQ